jgi:hypothetical protein
VNYDEPLSNFAFNFNFRHYKKSAMGGRDGAKGGREVAKGSHFPAKTGNKGGEKGKSDTAMAGNNDEGDGERTGRDCCTLLCWPRTNPRVVERERERKTPPRV